MKSKLSIGAKLGSGFGFLLVIIVVMVCFGISSNRKINGSLKDIVNSRTARTFHANQASKAVDDVLSSIKMLALLKDEKAIATEKQKIEDARGRYREAMAKLEEMVKTEEGKKLLEDMKSSIVPAVQANKG